MDHALFLQLGLSELQTVVYNALLDYGAQKAGSLSRRLEMKRGLAYKILGELEVLGLVERSVREGKVALYAPKHPLGLRALVEQRKKSAMDAEIVLDGVLPSLTSKFNIISGQPGVLVYEGEDGVERVLNDSLAARDGVIYTYADVEAVMKYIPEINKRYVKKRDRLGIEKKVMLLDNAFARDYMKTYHRFVTDVKFIAPDAVPFRCAMEIYSGKISYIIFSEKNMIGVIIADETIFNMHKAIFDYFWKMAKN